MVTIALATLKSPTTIHFPWIDDYLAGLEDPRREAIQAFHKDHLSLISTAAGSKCKHHVWEGGYLDHIEPCCFLATGSYKITSELYTNPFALSSAIIVLYFHDIEKPWKYGKDSPGKIDKWAFLREQLPSRYGITFSDDEWNALTYVHGEPKDEYNSFTRLTCPLTSLCGSADWMSARMWYEKGRRKPGLQDEQR